MGAVEDVLGAVRALPAYLSKHKTDYAGPTTTSLVFFVIIKYIIYMCVCIYTQRHIHTHTHSTTTTYTQCDIQNCLQSLPSVPWKRGSRNHPQLRTTAFTSTSNPRKGRAHTDHNLTTLKRNLLSSEKKLLTSVTSNHSEMLIPVSVILHSPVELISKKSQRRR